MSRIVGQWFIISAGVTGTDLSSEHERNNGSMSDSIDVHGSHFALVSRATCTTWASPSRWTCSDLVECIIAANLFPKQNYIQCIRNAFSLKALRECCSIHMTLFFVLFIKRVFYEVKWLDWICFLTTHVLQDIFTVLEVGWDIYRLRCTINGTKVNGCATGSYQIRHICKI